MKRRVIAVMIVVIMAVSLCACVSSIDPIVGEWEMVLIETNGEYSDSDMFRFEFNEDNTGFMYLNGYGDSGYSLKWVEETTFDDDCAYIIELENGNKYATALSKDSNEYDTMAIVTSDENTIILKKVN